MTFKPESAPEGGSRELDAVELQRLVRAARKAEQRYAQECRAAQSATATRRWALSLASAGLLAAMLLLWTVGAPQRAFAEAYHVWQLVSASRLKQPKAQARLHSNNTWLAVTNLLEQPVVAVLRGPQLDVFTLKANANGAVTIDSHESAEIGAKALALAGDNGVSLGAAYQLSQWNKGKDDDLSNRPWAEKEGQPEWRLFSPAIHAYLFNPVDVDGDAIPELPITQQGVMLFLDKHLNVVNHILSAAQCSLSEWFYNDSVVFRDLNNDKQPEMVAGVATGYFIEGDPTNNRRRLAVYHTGTGTELGSIDLPSYPKIGQWLPTADAGAAEAILYTDSANNSGYRVNLGTADQPNWWTDQQPLLARIRFVNSHPEISWAPSMQEFTTAGSTALSVISPPEWSRQWLIAHHHAITADAGGNPVQPFMQVWSLDLRDNRLTGYPRLPAPTEARCGMLTGSAMLSDTPSPRLLITRQGELQVVNENLERQTGYALPSELASIKLYTTASGKTLALVWTNSPLESNAFIVECRSDGFTPLTEQHFESPLQELRVVSELDGELTIAVLGQQLEIWRCDSNLH